MARVAFSSASQPVRSASSLTTAVLSVGDRREEGRVACYEEDLVRACTILSACTKAASVSSSSAGNCSEYDGPATTCTRTTGTRPGAAPP